jgi:mRNA interferase YafQ
MRGASPPRIPSNNCSPTCMRTIEQSAQFKKDYRKAAKSTDQSGLDERLGFIIRCLLSDQQLPDRFKDHALKENWSGHRHSHVFPDSA